ncbi:MAG: DUF488 domain-containing protein [Chitinophagaceae bacterium]|nr:DUF488 domain-containing protein [Chitinophagaceae bacterium]
MAKKIHIKRIYENAAPDDGYRILIDRVWPRGMTKEKAKLDEWNKDIAPSTALRKWFNHEEERFAVFKKKYSKELAGQSATIQRLKKIAAKENLCLLYGAKNEQYNQAVVLKEILMAG